VPSGYTPLDSARDFFTRALEPGIGEFRAATGLRCSPDGAFAVLTGEVRLTLDGPATDRLYVLNLATKEISPISKGGESVQRRARWSPSGASVAFISDDGSPGIFHPWTTVWGDPSSIRPVRLSGYSAEAVEWSADGNQLLVLAAEEGAEQSVTGGSGSIPSSVADTDRPSWSPTVRRSGAAAGGWRVALLLDVKSGEVRRISPQGLNVWEGCLAADALLAVVSDLPWEGDWTNSRLELMALDGSWRRIVHQPALQLAEPVSAADASRFAVIEGLASDRGIVAGNIHLFDTADGTARQIDTQGVDVTCLRFRDRDHICATGVRDTDTVIFDLDLSDGKMNIHHAGLITTSGPFYPEAAPYPEGGALLCAESWSEPPHILHAHQGKYRELLALADDGQRWLNAQAGSIEVVRWKSSDGLEVSGFFVTPKGGKPPYRTILAVHGGPAWCWRSSWPAPDLLTYAFLSARGFALFMPNPRGSSGRGQEFLAKELGDYGGGEVDDLLTGLDQLVDRGMADPDRLAVYGVSHGGYMSCWLTTRTDRFKAAVAGSPVTDWYSQHFSSNIPDFDQMYLRASPRSPAGAYFERSPVFFAQKSKTPTLLSAGLVDRCTPPGQAVEFHQALLAAGVETELVLYPEEGHGIRATPARVDMAGRTAAFLERHLGAETA